MRVFAATVIVGLLVLMAGYAFGQHQYRQGYLAHAKEAAVARAKALEEARAIEHNAQKEMERVREEAQKHIQQAQVARATLARELDSLRKQIAPRSQLREATGPTSGSDGRASLCWLVLDESVQRYAEVAAEADEHIERLRLAQGWAKAVQKAHP